MSDDAHRSEVPAQPIDAAQANGTQSDSPQAGASHLDSMPAAWVARWQRIARRIRVPLGFLVAALYLFELVRRAPNYAAIAWSVALVVPGLWLRGYAAGTVKKNRELTSTGPYAYTRNPLYLGSMLIAAGFALALLSWMVALVLALGFLVIYVPVIASEERFLRATFPEYGDYARRVPRLLPRAFPARQAGGAVPSVSAGGFSPALYFKHREYNAVLGSALLYLCLLLLRSALGMFLNGLL
jgi:protein-S-isoprenylcysteine O-methyltransferase Ste14